MSVRQAEQILKDCNGLTYSTACSRLTKHYVVLGKGCWGTVFQVTKRVAVKVYKKHDLAYDNFVNLIAKVKSIHFPVIHDREITENFGFVFMELLCRYDLKSNYGLDSNELIDRIKLHVCGIDKPVDKPIPDTLADAVHGIRIMTSMYVCDVRRANLGKRGNTLVFLDPLANKYEPTGKRKEKVVWGQY